MRGQDIIFRALVVASALLTATLAAVLFVPGGGSAGEEVARAAFSPVAQAAEAGGPAVVAEGAERRAETSPLEAQARTADFPPAPDRLAQPLDMDRTEATPRPRPVSAGTATTPTEKASRSPQVDRLERNVGLSLRDEPAVAELARAALDRVALPDRVAARREVSTADDMQSLSAGVLAGFGLELPEPEAPAPIYPAAALRPQSHATSRAVLDSAGWTTDYVLVGLGQSPRKIVSPVDEARQWSTQYVLNGLRSSRAASVRAPDKPAEDGAPIALEQVIADAIREGHSDAYLEALIEELSAAGQLAAPVALMGPDGRVDSALVLNALVSASTLRQQPPSPAPGPRRRVQESVVYRVRPGDSLATIAYRFYGKSSRYMEIFEANRAAMPTPDDIFTGQRLTIPAG